MNRSLAGGNELKSLGLTRSGVSDAFSVLFDYLIRPCQHVGRNRQAHLLRRLEINQ